MSRLPRNQIQRPRFHVLCMFEYDDEICSTDHVCLISTAYLGKGEVGVGNGCGVAGGGGVGVRGCVWGQGVCRG